MKYICGVLIIIALASCKKTKCWQCEFVQRGYPDTTVTHTKTTVCDKTEAQIRDEESINTIEMHYPDGAVFQQTYKCQ